MSKRSFSTLRRTFGNSKKNARRGKKRRPAATAAAVQLLEDRTLLSGVTVEGFQKIAAGTAGLDPLQSGSNFGASVTSLGDLDGNGVNDLAVGIPEEATLELGDRGAVQILFLNADGTVDSATKITNGAGGMPAGTLQANVRFGSSVASVGDLDGDGITELAVGAPTGNSGANQGAVYVLFLNSDGTVKPSKTQKIGHGTGGPSLSLGDRFGQSVDGIGDLDGDGVTELAVGASLDDSGGTNRGAVHVLFLNADASIKSATKIHSGNGGGLGGGTLSNNEQFGTAVTSLGDIDGDGAADLAVGPRFGTISDGTGQGAAYIVFLNDDGTVKTSKRIADGTNGLPAGTLGISDSFGQSVASLGDLNGDGVSELAVGALGENSGRGAVHVLFLNDLGQVTANTKIAEGVDGLPGGTLSPGDLFGSSIAAIGDLDGDGLTDLAVGSPRDDTGGTSTGALYIVRLAPVVETNEPPTANAGGPYVALEGDTVHFNGTLSSDPDDLFADLAFEWDLNYDGVTFVPAKTGAQLSETFEDDVATRMIALRVTDPDGLSDIATTMLTVNNVSPTVSGPVLVDTHEDDASSIIVNLLAGADDPGEFDELSIANLTLTGGDASGVTALDNRFSINAWAYNHLAAGQSEVITYSFDIVDGDGGSVAQTATITIEGRNDAPSSIGLIRTGTEDSPVAFSTADFAAGFSDPDNGDALVEIRIDSLAASGTLYLNGTAVTAGQIIAAADLDDLVFVPALNFNGETSFTYSVGDGHSFASTSATATLDILSATDQAFGIYSQIDALLASGTINAGQAEALKFDLKENHGDTGKVQAFLNKVQGFIDEGILTEDEAEGLLSAGNLLFISVST